MEKGEGDDASAAALFLYYGKRTDTKAAESLYVSQSSLSYALSELEKELNVPLFEKQGKQALLSQYGEVFLPCAPRTHSTRYQRELWRWSRCCPLPLTWAILPASAWSLSPRSSTLSLPPRKTGIFLSTSSQEETAIWCAS